MKAARWFGRDTAGDGNQKRFMKNTSYMHKNYVLQQIIGRCYIM